MPKTGEACQQAGVYSGTCSRGHRKELAVNVRERFPPCGEPMQPKPCDASIAWTLVRTVEIKKP